MLVTVIHWSTERKPLTNYNSMVKLSVAERSSFPFFKVFEMFIQPLTQPGLNWGWQAQNQADKGQRLKDLKVPTGIDNHMRALGT